MKLTEAWRKYGMIIGCLILWACLFFIAYRIPYCHDEWQWGLPERIELMKTGFRDYNGRYLGNILALIITRSVWAKGLILSGGILWLLKVMDGCLGAEGEDGRPQVRCLQRVCSAVLLLVLPSTLFAQSYGWPAAFVNFVPPVILFLIYFGWTESVYRGEELHAAALQYAAVIPLAVATQLFSEHITIFAVLYAGWVAVLYRIRIRKFHPLHAAYFLGTVAGAAIMFSNGAYRNAAADTDGYKHIAFSLSEMLQKCSGQIMDHLFLNNWIPNTLLAVLLVAFLIRSGRKNLLTAEMTLAFVGYSVYGIWHRICPSWVFVGREFPNDCIEMLLAAVFFLNVLLCIWLFTDRGERGAVCALYISMAAVAVPLLAASPIGARCFYVSYVFECLVILRLFGQLLRAGTADLYYPILCAVCCAAILLVIYMRMFLLVGQTDRQRSELIGQAVAADAEEVVLPILPYSDYFWTTVPPSERWAKRFRKFYHIPKDMELRFE